MGLHPNPWCTLEFVLQGFEDHDCQHLERVRNRARPGAGQEDALAYVPQGSQSLAAVDFFTEEVVTLGRFVTYHFLIVLGLSTRRVQMAGLTSSPDTAFMMQIGRNLTSTPDGFLLGKRFLIMDRDGKYSEVFRDLVEGSGTNIVRLPARSSNLNAYAERFVLSIKQECLERMIFFSEKSLRLAVSAYVVHYHKERNHRGLENQLIEPEAFLGEKSGKVRCRDRLGGMLKYYYREAA